MNNKTKTIVGIGLLTAVIVILQALGASIRFGMFSISFVLIPIIVGAALFGEAAGLWLGAVFGFVVLMTDAGLFLAINVPGTIITVMVKGMLAGLAAAFVYRKLESKSALVAAILAGVVAPVCNTGIFLIGCRVFFYDTIKEWAAAAGFQSAGAYLIMGLAGVNFLVELAINLVLSTVIVRIVGLGRKTVMTEE